MPRPFRFGVNMLAPAPGDAWREKCRRAEELGYDVILAPDHLGMAAPFPALIAAAEATERPRLGTFVLNAGFWNPTLLAREAATADALTGGRLELGLGTGYVPVEHETAGLPFGSPRERVDHLQRTVEEVGRLLGSPDHQPQPVQPRVPLLIGGNGDRMLRLTAEHADIAAFAGGRAVPGDKAGMLAPLTADELDERVATYRRYAADARPEPAELNLLVQLVVVTDDPGAAVSHWLPIFPQFTEDQILGLPIVLVGTADEIVRKVRAQRERYGFSYVTVMEHSMEAFGQVMGELRASG
ncbi:TIGR03621 family F420-dependent LLM class oxidoreductase [Streptomyces sp. NPDC091292]|uniref:TIGR03621 family F420-dependent LLM class oxidoreductase n=1 Tax=Streptomyces sp. NPDC091292 TaxID=3365991 RepID=UPI00382BBE9B